MEAFYLKASAYLKKKKKEKMFLNFAGILQRDGQNASPPVQLLFGRLVTGG